MATTDTVVVGTGPAALAAAEVLAAAGRPPVVVEAMAAPGAKFLIAGRGGINLANERTPETGTFAGSCADCIRAATTDWPAAAVRAWADNLGADSFVGSGGRILPRGLHSAPLLRAWLARLAEAGVALQTHTRLVDLQPGPFLTLAHQDQRQTLRPRAVILALGGASWPQTGSDAAWTAILDRHGVAREPFLAANCGVDCDWPPAFGERWAGTPVKNLTLSHAGQTSRGQVVVTRHGLEGQALYPLIPGCRPAWNTGQAALLTLDLAPERERDDLARRLAGGRAGDSLANRLRKRARLAPVAAALVGRLAAVEGRRDALALAATIKALPVPALRPRPLAEAISCAGGIAAAALDGWQLRALPGVWACGEMCDWEAPTGGWLVHACLASGRAAAADLLVTRPPTTAGLRRRPVRARHACGRSP